MIGLLAGLLAFGTVFSTQFAVWLIALAAAALCRRFAPRVRVQLLSVLPIAGLTHLGFLALDEAQEPRGLMLLGIRNVMVLVAAFGVLVALREHRRPEQRKLF